MADEEKSSIAERWIKRIDDNSPAMMMDDAVSELEVRGAWVYIFEDGSSAYEKRRGDWYPAEQYVQCPDCEEWRKGDESKKLCDDCAADDEQAAAN
jgi:hypothetical protein